MNRTYIITISIYNSAPLPCSSQFIPLKATGFYFSLYRAQGLGETEKSEIRLWKTQSIYKKPKISQGNRVPIHKEQTKPQ